MRYSLILLICILLSCRISGQQSKSFYVYDKSAQSPLCYASVFNISGKTGSITNTDGSCTVQYHEGNDSLIISYIGFESLLTQIVNLTAADTIFLKPHMLLLDEVTISSPPNHDVLVDQLYDVFSYNSRKNASNYSKANMLVQSYIDNVPLERIESIGNLNIKNGGVFEYCHIMGRFGQNPESKFFTLSTESILNNFQLFELPKGNLPLFITQMSKNKIAKSYNLKRRMISNELTKIIFEANEPTLFSGYVIFNELKDILSIHFIVNDVFQQFVKPAFNEHSLAIM